MNYNYVYSYLPIVSVVNRQHFVSFPYNGSYYHQFLM